MPRNLWKCITLGRIVAIILGMFSEPRTRRIRPYAWRNSLSYRVGNRGGEVGRDADLNQREGNLRGEWSNERDQDRGETAEALIRDQDDQSQVSAPDPTNYDKIRSIRVVGSVETDDEERDVEVVILDLEDKDDLDLELAGINDPKPSCRKRISEKSGKKKKKKKGSAPPVVRTYDEIIESGVYKNSDDEFDLEAYFSGDLI